MMCDCLVDTNIRVHIIWSVVYKQQNILIITKIAPR